MALVRRYCVTSIDNENTQFLRYLKHEGASRKRNFFEVRPGGTKADGSEVTQAEADHANEVVPKDIFTGQYFWRQTQEIAWAMLVGISFASLCIGGAALYFRKKNKQA